MIKGGGANLASQEDLCFDMVTTTSTTNAFAPPEGAGGLAFGASMQPQPYNDFAGMSQIAAFMPHQPMMMQQPGMMGMMVPPQQLVMGTTDDKNIKCHFDSCHYIGT